MKFRKKPVEVDAIQFIGTEENYDKLCQFTGIVLGRLKHAGCVDKPIQKLYIRTLEGEMTADINDWIIKGVNGEFYPCKPDIFEKTYEQIERCHHGVWLGDVCGECERDK